MKPRIWGKIAILVILATAIGGAILPDMIREHRARRAAQHVEVALPHGVPVLLELGSDSCRPCQMMQPVLAELRKEYDGKLGVVFVDVWKNPAVAEKYGVQSIPTQVFLDAQGKERFRHVGYYAKDDILKKFRELGIAL